MSKAATISRPYTDVLQSKSSIKTYFAFIYILLSSISGKPVSRLCTGYKLFDIKIVLLKQKIF